MNCTWSSLLEELVEVQRGGSRVGLLRSGRRGGGLFRFLHGVFKRRAGVGPGGGGIQKDTVKLRNNAGFQSVSGVAAAVTSA